MNDRVPRWNEGEEATICVDGTFVGLARCVRAELPSRKVWLDGLDSLATMYFSGLVGRAGEHGTRVGVVLIGDRGEPTRTGEIRTLSMGRATVDDFSSGTHHVALVAEGLDMQPAASGAPRAPAG